LANISVISSYLENFKEKYLKDKYFASIYKTLKNSDQSDKKQQACARHYELKDNKLYLKEDQCLAISMNKELRTKLLKEYHDIKIAGHLGIDKTYEAIRRDYFWPKMSKDVRKFVLTCNSCQCNKSSNQQSAELLETLTTPTTK